MRKVKQYLDSYAPSNLAYSWLRARLTRLKAILVHFIPAEEYHKKRFTRRGYVWHDVTSPVALSDKLRWVLVYGDLELYYPYVDKLLVREFVKRTIGEKYLVPITNVWDTASRIRFADLPRLAVLKATHGSGYNFFYNGDHFHDECFLRKKLGHWLQEKFYARHRELQYRKCKPRIICEQFLGSESEKLLDYKFWCFHGEPKFCQVVKDIHSTYKSMNIYDLQWNLLPFTGPHPIGKPYPALNESIPKPLNYGLMVELARKLARRFPFVRVDLYNVQGRIYFGELTFTPLAGNGVFSPGDWDRKLGKLLDLSRYPVRNSEA